MMDRLNHAREALYGLWVGDAFGGHYEFEHVDWNRPKRAAIKRKLPPATWRYTDDTQMALSVYAVLRRSGKIDPDELAASFVQHFDISRGYGPYTELLLENLVQGGDWRILAPAQNEGQGSFGNGAAMRVAPVGAYFAGDMEAVIENARQSALVTHTHPEAVAGAIAIAVANAEAVSFRLSNQQWNRGRVWQVLLETVPSGELHQRLQRASKLPSICSTSQAAKFLGCGWDISAADTVPFALWCASRYINNFEEALWQTISVGGDADTTGAIVGSIVASYQGRQRLPQSWIVRCEPLSDTINE